MCTGADAKSLTEGQWAYALAHNDIASLQHLVATLPLADLQAVAASSTARVLCYVGRKVEQFLAARHVYPTDVDKLSKHPQATYEDALDEVGAQVMDAICRSQQLFAGDCTEHLGVGVATAVHRAVVATCLEHNLPHVLRHYFETHWASTTTMRTLLRTAPSTGATTTPQKSTNPTGTIYRRELSPGSTRTRKEARAPWLPLLLASIEADNGGSVFSVLVLHHQLLTANSDHQTPFVPSPALVLCALAYSGVPMRHALDQGLRHGSDVWYSSEVVRSAVSSFPLLRAHIQAADAAPSHVGADKVVTVYDLLLRGGWYDVVELLQFQETNAHAVAGRLASRDSNATASDMPHFSGRMSETYAVAESLDFRYYLQQGRPLHAHDVYKKAVTSGDTVGSREEIVCAIRELALFNFFDKSITSACLMFLELLHDDSEAAILRDDIAVATRIHRYRTRRATSPTVFDPKTEATEINALAQTLLALYHARQPRGGVVATINSDDSVETADDGGRENAYALLAELDAATRWLGVSVFGKAPRPTPQYGRMWCLVMRFCRRFDLAVNETFLIMCAEANDWAMFLGFAQGEHVPRAVVSQRGNLPLICSTSICRVVLMCMGIDKGTAARGGGFC